MKKIVFKTIKFFPIFASLFAISILWFTQVGASQITNNTATPNSVSSTNGNFQTVTTTDINIEGFATLGELGVPVKMAVFDGTFPSSQGTYSTVTLTGIDASKIVGIQVNGMWASNGAFMSNQFQWISSYAYDWYMSNGTNPTMYLLLSNTNSLSMIDKPVKILIFYTE